MSSGSAKFYIVSISAKGIYKNMKINTLINIAFTSKNKVHNKEKSWRAIKT
jgi:uncharacterized pyridoxamine 5'-phosphate oxidase family protein